MNKLLFSALLYPLARLFDGVRGLERVWAYTRLRARMRTDLDRSVVVLGCPELHGTRNLRLGRNLYLYCDLHLETQAGGAIDIGDDVVISRGVHIVAFSGVRIGAGSMIGEYASIRDANHRYGEGVEPRNSGHDARPVEIGARVWIGRGASILAGVSIGDGAVIGANAVVTRDVAAGAVVGGVPARPLRTCPGESQRGVCEEFASLTQVPGAERV